MLKVKLLNLYFDLEKIEGLLWVDFFLFRLGFFWFWLRFFCLRINFFWLKFDFFLVYFWVSFFLVDFWVKVLLFKVVFGFGCLVVSLCLRKEYCVKLDSIMIEVILMLRLLLILLLILIMISILKVIRRVWILI